LASAEVDCELVGTKCARKTQSNSGQWVGESVRRCDGGQRVSKGDRPNSMNKLAQRFQELEVYQASFRFQQEIFEASKQWPLEERYALTDQVRRSSRSIGANIAEAWAKRRYPAHFVSKLTDSDGELQEARHWLSSAFACRYLSDKQHVDLVSQAEIVGKMLGTMIRDYETFTL